MNEIESISIENKLFTGILYSLALEIMNMRLKSHIKLVLPTAVYSQVEVLSYS